MCSACSGSSTQTHGDPATFTGGCHFASSTEQGESRMMLWAVLPITRSKIRLWP